MQPIFDNDMYNWILGEERVSRPKRALICGHSQVGGIGLRLKKILESNNFSVDAEQGVVWKNGIDTAGLASLLANFKMNHDFNYDVTIIFSGGANGSKDIQEASINQILSLFPRNTMKIWLGNSPRTVNKNGEFDAYNAKLREESNASMKAYISNKAVYLDYREMGLDGAKQPSGVVFPTLPDGIHMNGGVAQKIASIIYDVISGANTFRTSGQRKVEFGSDQETQEKKAKPRSRMSDEELFAYENERLINYAKERAEEGCNLMGNCGYGSNNKDMIKKIQTVLIASGNLSDKETDVINSEFGDSTLEAVLKFQKEKGLRSDGCVGPKTLSAMGLQDSGITTGQTSKVPLQTVFEAIEAASAKYGVPLETMLAIAKIESGFNSSVKNKSGAAGLYQFMPSTAKAYGLTNPLDPVAAADAGARYLQSSAKSFNVLGTDDEYLVYMAHQQGAGGTRTILNAASKGFDIATLQEKLPQTFKNMSNNSANKNWKTSENPAQAFLDGWKSFYNSRKNQAVAAYNSNKGYA